MVRREEASRRERRATRIEWVGCSCIAILNSSDTPNKITELDDYPVGARSSSPFVALSICFFVDDVDRGTFLLYIGHSCGQFLTILPHSLVSIGHHIPNMCPFQVVPIAFDDLGCVQRKSCNLSMEI